MSHSRILLLAAVVLGFQSCGSAKVKREDALPFSPAAEVVHAPEARAESEAVATWYGKRYQGRKTASGERFDYRKLTAAHRTLKFGTRLRVTNPRNGLTVVVRVNDRGPYGSEASLDLSQEAARKLGVIHAGRARVLLTQL